MAVLLTGRRGPTDDTTRLAKAALAGLKAIYRSGYNYKKSGVLLMGLQARETVQASLFDEPARLARAAGMMHVMDGINWRMGQGKSDHCRLWHPVSAGRCVGSQSPLIT